MNAVCPRCLDAEAEVSLNVSDGDTLHCDGCGEDFTVVDIRAVVDSWGPLLPWLEAHQARKPVEVLTLAAS